MTDCAGADGDTNKTDPAQLDYEVHNVPVREISKKHGISERALYRRIREEGWIARRPSQASASLAERLKLVVRREMAGLERSIAEGGAPGGGGSILARVQLIARTFDRICVMEKKENVARRRKPKPRLIDDARCEALARRFEALGRQIELECHSKPAHPR